MASARTRSAIRSMGLENIRFAMRSILVQRLRSFLTLLGIVSGVATVIAMVSFVAGFNDAITGAFSSFGTTLVQYQKYEPRFGGGPTGPPEEQRKRRDLTLEDAQALKRQNTLAAAVSPERYLNLPGLAASTTFKNRKGKEANGPTLAGVVPDYAAANNASIEDGRFFGDADVSHSARTAVVGPDVADALWFHRDPINQELLINGVAFRVIGLLEKRGSFLGGSADNIVLIPFSTFDEMFPDVKNSNGDTIHIATIPRDRSGRRSQAAALERTPTARWGSRFSATRRPRLFCTESGLA